MPMQPVPTRDPDPGELDRLVAESVWVRRLALAVAREAHAADDLAQDAWLAALARPPREPGSRRGWFSRVVGNLDRLRVRGDSNRAARERLVARPEAGPDPSLALERIEMQEARARARGDEEGRLRSAARARYVDRTGPRS